MTDEKILFFSEEWISIYKDALNANEEYKTASKTWEGDIIFQIDADGDKIKEPLRVYMNLYHGECLEARLETPDDTAEFVYSGSLKNWKKLMAGEIGPIRGIMSRKFKVDGSMAKLTRYIKSAQVKVSTAATIPTKFPDE